METPMNEAAEEKDEAKADPLHEHREAFKSFQDAWADDRKRYVADIKFSAGEQWDLNDVKAREKDGRPALVVDKLNQYVKQVVNDSRQNRPGIKVRPVDSGADVETAEIFQGLIRHIEDRSNSDTAYDTALESAVKGGFGFFRILREYASSQSFDQELCFKRIRNPLTVLFDPDCQEPDGSDSRRVFIWEDLPEDIYEASYPNAEPVDWEAIGDDASEWYGEKKVRVAECYWVETEQVDMHLLADGSVAGDDEINEAKAEGVAVPEIVDTRKMDKRVVKWAKFNGKEYLDGPKTEPGRWIPVLPVWGNEVDIEGKVIHTGMIHSAKDAQKLYNYSRTASAERLSKPGTYVAADGQVADYMEDWDGSNRNVAVKRYSPIDINGNSLPPPRFDATDIPSALVQDMQMSEHDIQGALGMYNASLGQQSNEKSGKAIMARQREGDMANFHYHDNLARAIRHAGRILVDLIPKVYDTKRVVRVLGMDGTAEMAQIDPNQPVAMQKLGSKSIYNLKVGEYDVSVSSGPSYTTQRQEAAEAMSQMFQGNPQLMGLIGDLFFRSMDWPGAEDIADRLKLTLPPEIQQAEQSKGEQNPEVQQVIQQTQQALQQKDQMIEAASDKIEELMGQVQLAGQEAQSKQGDLQVKAAELQIKEQELRIKEGELQIKQQELAIKQYDAETKRLQAQASAQEAEGRLSLDAYTAQSAAQAPAASPVEPKESQPINITIDGQRPIQKTAKATRQPDGSYIMESIEMPVGVE
jgi:hypothetical protein